MKNQAEFKQSVLVLEKVIQAVEGIIVINMPACL